VIVKVAGMVPTVFGIRRGSAPPQRSVLGNRLGRQRGDHRRVVVDVGDVEVIVFGVGLRPSEAVTCTNVAVGAGRRAMRLEVRRRFEHQVPPTMSNSVESAPPVIVKVAGMVPTVSASVRVSAAINGLVLRQSTAVANW